MRLITAIFLPIGIANFATVLGSQPHRDLPVALTKFVDDHTVAIAGVRLREINFDVWHREFLEPICRDEVERVHAAAIVGRLKNWSESVPADGSAYVVVTLANLPNLPPGRFGQTAILPATTFVVLPGIQGPALEQLRDAVAQAKGPFTYQDFESTAVIASRTMLQKLEIMQPRLRADLVEAVGEVDHRPAWLAVVPPPIFTRAAEEILHEPRFGLDAPVGRVIGRGLRWAAIGLEPDSMQFNAKLTIQTADPSAALEFAKLCEGAASELGKTLASSDKDYPTNSAALLRSLVPKIQNDRLELLLDSQQTAAIMTFAQKTYRVAMTGVFRNRSMNNLKQIALALHNYYDVNKHFPAAIIRDKDGKPLLSWRVAILPYIEGAKLYKEFHLDEPWDSEHNRKLIEKIPEELRSPDSGHLHPGRTRYLAAVGENLAFPPDRALVFKDILDGTSKTIMVVEADPDHAVIWTKPEDIEIDPENPARGLAEGNEIFCAAFADGHVQGFMGAADPATLWAMFTRNGGEVIDYEKLKPK